jgi:hypothetical protein
MKDGDLQHILDHQAELQREVKLGAGLWDGNRTIDLWFMIPVLPAQSVQEHDEHAMAHIRETLQDILPNWAWPLLNSLPQEYHIVAKTLNDTLEMWYFP